MKSHAIIEKTAKFIASQGSQMEIILKTKQSGNSQFNFLDYSDPLNAYYKHLVQAIRSNAYVPPAQDSSNVDDNHSSSKFKLYLLARSTRPFSIFTSPNIFLSLRTIC